MVDNVITARTQGILEVRKTIKNVPVFFYNAVFKILQKRTTETHDKVLQNFNTSGVALSGAKLSNRTGYLAKSIRAEVKGKNLDDITASVYTRAIYAPIHETGGTIKAKDKYGKVPGGPYLNIPLKANKTPAGVTKLSASEVFAEGGFIFKSQQGNWIVASPGFQFDAFGDVESVPVPMFVLKQQVYIPRRLGMIQAGLAQVPKILQDIRNLRLKDV